MRKFHSKLHVCFNISRRFLSSELNNKLKTGYVDIENKLVYGGDLPIFTSTKSVGRILFERLKEKAREDKILQVCTSTKNQLTTKVYLQRAVAVAERLRESGVDKGDFIVLLGNNSLNMNTALTGIMLMGAVPVPITYKTRLEEFSIMMSYIKPKFFGCEKKYVYPFKRILERSPDFKTSKVFLLNEKKDPTDANFESFEEFTNGRGLDVESFKPVEVDNPEEELALALKPLTDGKVGRIVGITHHNINSVIARFDSKHEQRFATKVILMVQKVMWMSGIYSLFLCCCYGCKLIIMSEFDEENFVKTIEEYKVNGTYMHSAKLWQLYKHTYEREYDLSSCKHIYAVDGAVPQTLINGLKEKTGLVIIPTFGVSELTGIVLKSEGKRKEDSVGKLLPQVFCKVVSENNENLEPNKMGQLCFKGPIITKGYINDEKSMEQLLDKDGFFCSGLYGYYDEEGNFFIIDRINYVIKYKEFNVSPRELEAVIRSIDSVKDVAVSGIQHPTDGYLPVAFVALQRGQKTTADDIIRHVNEKVADYKKLRGGVVFISKIPRSRDYGDINRSLIRKVLSKFKIEKEVELEPLPEQKQPEVLVSKQSN